MSRYILRIKEFVASVNCRLAPEYPFPTGMQDFVSAVLWLWQHAEEYNLDISRTAISGFSAGANLSYATAIQLHEELEKVKKQNNNEKPQFGKLISLVTFYGSTDWTQSRAERDASNPNLILVIPPSLLRLFDESYLCPPLDMNSPLLSPGKAPDQLLKGSMPDKLVIINCEGDQLLAKSERFKSRFRNLGKKVDGSTVEGVGHAWDKTTKFSKGKYKER